MARILFRNHAGARGFVGELWFSTRDNQNMEVFWVMLLLDVSRCAGDIGNTNVNTKKMNVWDVGKHGAFEAVALGGAGLLLLTMDVVLLCLMKSLCVRWSDL